jgi:hypothetical protein
MPTSERTIRTQAWDREGQSEPVSRQNTRIAVEPFDALQKAAKAVAENLKKADPKKK